MTGRPPFCPNPACDYHTGEPHHHRWFIKRGTHPNSRIGPVQRFQCRRCKRTFSRRTFSVHFATHHLIDLKRLVLAVNASAGIRDVARWFCVSEKVILNRISRVARQAIAVHGQLRSMMQLQEDLVADGIESFVGSQYWPNAFTILVGAHSQYFYSVDYAQMRRKGRMTHDQRRRRDALNRRVALAAGQTERSFARILSEVGYLWLQPPSKQTLVLTTDCHKSYRRVIDCDRQLIRLRDAGRFVHRRIESSRPRTRKNPLFSVNYFDREIRKDQACHVRETVQYSRDVNNAMERMWLYGVFHNCFKRRRINGTDPRTHAESTGVPGKALSRHKRHFFSRRYFFSRQNLSDSQWRTWLRGWQTPQKRVAQRIPAYVIA